MKIKAVCDATGLTDRTIRYYIAEALISPAFTENYLGRKTFDFSEGDIQQLRDIAVLRKFGFSIPEIKEMLLHPERIVQIVRELQARKQALIDEESSLLLTLSRLDAGASYTVADLAAYLSAPVSDTPVPAEDEKRDIPKLLLAVVKTSLLFLITWSPVAVAVWAFFKGLHWYYYPVFLPITVVLAILAPWPSFLTLLLPKIPMKDARRKKIKVLLLILCVLSMPACFIFPFGCTTRSETTDFRNYRDFDAECLANRSSLFQDLFPLWPHYFENVQKPDGSFDAVYLDAHYYYQYSLGWDYTYDIYAQWPLEEEAFYEEVARVREVFDAHAPDPQHRGEFRDYLTVQRGQYTCLIIYHGNPPFEEVTGSYTYAIFAYDEQALRVRYIYCDSLDDGADQPYYLTLDWA